MGAAVSIVDFDRDELFELHRATCGRLDVPRAKPTFEWPAGFDRIPDEEWTSAPLSEAGLAYDHVDEHGWYDNLNPSVAQLAEHLRDGDILVDYSGGTEEDQPSALRQAAGGDDVIERRPSAHRLADLLQIARGDHHAVGSLLLHPSLDEGDQPLVPRGGVHHGLPVQHPGDRRA